MKKIIKKKKVLNKVVTSFRPAIRSRHPTHNPLRNQLQRLPFRSLIRFGSTTPSEDKRVELNSVEAIKNSSSKLRMKNCFKQSKVKTADWIYSSSVEEIKSFLKINSETGVVMKSHYGSRGKGNTLIKTGGELIKWFSTHPGLNDYIVEKFYNYSREYRLHCDKNGCFYTCRKMIKSDTPDDKRWYKNNDNSVWIMEDNPSFDKPINWDNIVSECVKAVVSCGLDFGAVDLRIQSAKDRNGRKRKEPDFIVLEVNSAPSFGEVTLEKYLERLPILLKNKKNGQ